MTVSRRTFINRLVLAGGAAAGASAFAARAGLFELYGGELKSVDGASGYGVLSPRATANTGETLLHLPEGFQYNVIGRAGSAMSDGRPTPPLHDGMAAFSVNGKIRLVRNHEIGARVVSPLAAQNAYDQTAGGGTTTLVVNGQTREVERSFVSLSGTAVNCAGGPTPWGSWISCEETVAGPTNGFAQPHGYCFEVPAGSDTPAEPVPLRAMGRFVHEAVAVDPLSGVVYLTEDRETSGLYRFLPLTPGRLSSGGKLQMLAIRDQRNYDTRKGQTRGLALAVAWVDIPQPDPAGAELNSLAVFQQGLSGGGATFARLEGAWFTNGSLYFVSTNGGNLSKGQIWEYRLRSPSLRQRPIGRRADAQGVLRLLFESPGAEVLDEPDNICSSPRGGFLLCEDGPGEDMLRGLTADGTLFDFARNSVPGHGNSEFAGSTFSPDGETLFVNLQGPGLTFAIWGPWSRGGL